MEETWRVYFLWLQGALAKGKCLNYVKIMEHEKPYIETFKTLKEFIW